MKQLTTLLVVLTCTLHLSAQISLTATSGTLSGTYTTLKGAFDKINDGTHQGAVTLVITANTTETVSAVLNASGSGAASYTSIQLYPQSTGITISGALATPLIDLNGADNVTIDGRVGGVGSTKDLTITNSSTSAVAGTSTIRFTNDAVSNTVQYCTVKGSTLSTADGIFSFTATGPASGNDNNTITNNNITCNATSRPLTTIYSIGNSTGLNSGNSVSNNSIYNFMYTANGSSYGVSLSSYNSSWTITGNSFYETTALSTTGTVSHTVIYISAVTGSGTSFIVTNNYIGGSAASCSGTWTKSSASGNQFTGIQLSTATGGTASTVTGNTIQNISYTHTTSGSSLYGINHTAGDATISNNIIGAGTGNGSIIQTNTSTGAFIYGITLGSTGATTCQNNTIGSLTAATSGATACQHIYGINRTGSGTSTISNNTIGSTSTSNSINASSTSTSAAQTVFGIYNSGSGTVSHTGNTIANLTNGTTNTTVSTTGQVGGIYTAAGTNTISNNTIYNLTIANANNTAVNTSAVLGITLTYTTAAAQTISGNTVYNLSNTYTSFAGNVTGIYYNGSNTASTVSRNFVHSLSVTSTSSTTASVYGIKIAAGTTTYSNNIISLGGNNTTTLYGIAEPGNTGSNSLYFNTVYLSGSPSSGSQSSYALYCGAASTTRIFMNNLLINERSSAAGSHFALYFAATGGTLTCNANNYYVSGTGGVLGYYGSNKTALPVVTSVTGNDAISKNSNPVLATAGGVTATDYLPSATALSGIAGTGITVDYTNATRSYHSIGAYDYSIAPNISLTATAGTLSGSYSTLKTAFDAINAGTHTGDISLAVNASTMELSSAVLNNSGNGSSSYTSVIIYPTNSGLFISGAIATPLIDLNGADNVTIDGRVNQSGSTVALSISNTSTSNTAGTSTIRYRTDATGNTIRYCTITGSTLDANGGVVFFSNANAATGCDNNTIEYCNLTNADPANTSRPINMIYSVGTTGFENSSNVIRYNNIYDFFKAGNNSTYGIYLYDFNSAWTFTGNSFYETTAFATTTTNVNYNCLYITYTTYAGSSYSITGNYFGGRAANAGGAAWTKTGGFTNNLTVIYVKSATGAGNETNIDGNTIRNFNWSCAGAVSAGTFNAISLSNGDHNVGKTTGNTIGASTGTGSITLDLMNFNGIANSSLSGVFDCRNNVVGSIYTSSTGNSIASSIYGITFNNSNTAVTVTGNTVGSSTEANSINAASLASGAAQYVWGIFCGSSTSTGTQLISNNTVANMTNGTTNSTAATNGSIGGIIIRSGANTVTNNIVYNLTNGNANTQPGYNYLTSAYGIYVQCYANTSHLVSSNTVYGISNSYPGFAGNVSGLIVNSSNGTLTTSKNFIHSLSVTGAGSTTANIFGLYLYSGVSTVCNNVVYLGGNTSTGLYGITDGNSGTHSIYYNTVYLSGSLAAGATNTSAGLNNISVAPTRNYRNNLLINTRSTDAGSNLHYALYISGSTGTITCDYNDYITSGTGGTLGYFGAVKTTSVIVTNQDVFSKNLDPGLLNAGSTTATNYMASNTGLPGSSSTGITDDFNSSSRVYSAMGAFEYPVDQYVHVTASAGTANGYYSVLKDAFDAINTGTHKSNIAISIRYNITETATASLNASGSGGSSYAAITITPSGSRTINGNIAGELIALNGADGVTINGLNSGGNSLTIINQSTSSAASVISFNNDASNNTLQQCSIQGSVTPTLSSTDLSETSSTRGVIYFGSTVTATGNSSNTISHCDIGAYSTSYPWSLIYSYGGATYLNQNTITDNTLHDFHYNFNSTSFSNRISAVYLSVNNNAWTISGNTIYQSVSRNFTNYGNRTAAILLKSGQGHTVTNNIIGGAAADNSGTMTITGTPWSFYAIEATSLGTVNKTTISGNVLKNLSFTTSVDQNYSTSDRPRFAGILIEAGYYDILNNIIGTSLSDASTSPSVAITATGATYQNYIGMIWHSTPGGTSIDNITGNQMSGIKIDSKNIGNWNSPSFLSAGITVYGDKVGRIDNNIVGSATVSNSIYITGDSPNATNYNAFGFRGIWTYSSAAASPDISISGNTVGNINMYVTGTLNANIGYLAGIDYSCSSDATVNNNTVTNLSTNFGTFTTNGYNGEITGIRIVNTSYATSVTGNKVTALNSLINSVTGMSIYTGSSSTKIVSRNFVSQLSAGYNTTGIYTSCSSTGTTFTISNNLISTGSTSGNALYGLQTSGTGNVYHNSIYLSGSGAANGYSSCLFSLSYDATKLLNVKNNLFFHNRTRTTGAYSLNAIWLYNGTTGATVDYNNYYTPNTGGSVGALSNAATQYSTLAAFRTATGQDANTINADPLFYSAGGSIAENYIPAAAGQTGVTGTGVIDDYFRFYRSTSIPAIGAFEYVKIWTGTISENWNNAANWQPGLPGSTDHVLFSSESSNDLTLDQDRTINGINFNSSAHKVVLGNYNLTAGICYNANTQSYVKTNGTGLYKSTIANEGSYTFAAGNSSYNPLSITNYTGTEDLFSVRLTDAVYQNSNEGQSVQFPHITRTWHIGKTNPNKAGGIELEFNWNQGENSGTMITPTLFHYSDNRWNRQTGLTSVTATSFSHSGYTGSFSPFAIIDGASTLPATGLNLTAAIQHSHSMLNWHTLSEENTSGFEVQHSTNGTTWSVVETQAAAGFSDQRRNYSAVHNHPQPGSNFYRIKLTDLNGSHRYSPIVVVYYKAANQLLAYPNPTTGIIQVMIPEGISPAASFQVIDLNGQLLKQQHGIKPGLFTTDISQFPAGIYLLKVTDGKYISHLLITKH